MYAIYCYNAGATKANVASDVFALIGGETNKANLSASCNQTNTSIVANLVPNWTVYDAAAGTDHKVFRSLNADGTTYKYYGLNFNDVGQLTGRTFDTWNSTTHTGTNISENVNSWDATAGGYFYIYVTSNSLIIYPYVTGSGFKTLSGTLLFELTGSPALVTGTNYSKHVFCYNSTQINTAIGGSQSYMPRIKSPNSPGDVQSAPTNIAPVSAVQQASTQFISYNPFYRDISDNVYVQLSKFGVMYLGLFMGESYDVYTCPKASLNNFDEVTYNGNTYVVFVLSTFAILFRKD